MRSVLYIAGPYRGPREWDVTQNIRRAEAAAIECWKKGWMVFCPHKNTAYFGGILPDHVWLDGDLLILERCDAMLVIEGWELSEGAQMEYQKAIDLGMPIYHSIDEVPDERE